MSLPVTAEILSLQFTINTLLDELRHQESHFDRLDCLYSQFFFLQNDYARFLHRIGDIATEERDGQWQEIDLQEREWEAHLEDWRALRFQLKEMISQFQDRLRELQKTKEAARVAA